MYTIIGWSVDTDCAREVFCFDTDRLEIIDSILWQNRENFTFDMVVAREKKLIAIEVLKDGDLFYCD